VIPSTPGRRSRWWGRLAGAAVLAALAAAAPACGSGVDTTLPRGRGSDAGPAESVGPTADTTWWFPVRGEPRGVAGDDAAVAIATFDRVVLLGAADGAPQWQIDIPGLSDDRPALDAATVVVTSRGGVIALERATGSLRFATALANPGPAAIAPDGATVVASEPGGAVVALDARTGSVRWRTAFPGEIHNAPSVAGAVVVAAWRGDVSVLRGLDLASGAVVWQTGVGARTGAPLVRDGVAVLADGDGNYHARIRALDLATGVLRWSTPVPASFEATLEPAADRRDVAVVDHFGTVTLLDLVTGSVRWQQETGRPTITGPVVLTSDAVVYASYPNVLVVLDRATGVVRSATPEPGVPTDLGQAGGHLVLALRLGAPSRVEARDLP
jgi:outer membrane protein assembly factor BamB